MITFTVAPSTGKEPRVPLAPRQRKGVRHGQKKTDRNVAATRRPRTNHPRSHLPGGHPGASDAAGIGRADWRRGEESLGAFPEPVSQGARLLSGGDNEMEDLIDVESIFLLYRNHIDRMVQELIYDEENSMMGSRHIRLDNDTSN